MPAQTLPRRLATATRWPVGVALTSWRYLWRTTPLYRSEDEGSWAQDGPPGIPDGVSHRGLQPPSDGAGPLYHRRYEVRIRDTGLSPEQLVERVAADPDRAAPSEFATFKKTFGAEGEMLLGDEYLVRMPGPWDGPVRIIEREPRAFRLATLQGHLEAGQIQFSADCNDGLTRFTIESWARGGDRLSNLLYDRLRLSKEIQFHMWTSFLEGVVGLSGGRREGGLRISTRRVSEESFAVLRYAEVNFEQLGGPGWNVDDYCQPLPSERPGPPEPDGVWERARRLMEEYEFADPAIVRATYAADSPLEGRDMLLEARFLGLRFRFGVRISGVTDEQREEAERPVRVWGWSYRTLKGHLETGQMDYEVWKWLDDGAVEFRIHVVSRAARIPNPLIRLGFRLFGRREQVRFARRALERMADEVAPGAG
jgi:uncharacterized protein (UPF0548 family)